jgi:hypothetical protein
MIGARDGDFAGFERLAQGVERMRLEFRNYVAVSPSQSKFRLPSKLKD